MVSGFSETGWLKLPFDADILSWVTSVLPAARASMSDPKLAHWWDCEDTWFVGVDALPNDARGAVGEGPALEGASIDVVRALFRDWPPLHKAQVSVTRPGYPRPRRGESEAAFGYRLNRAAAHVDGLKPAGPPRTRHIDEPHAFILGVPLTESHPQAAPLVIWEGSHVIMGQALRDLLCQIDPEDVSKVDVTEVYAEARKLVFNDCPRITVQAKPGEITVLHRHLLHGVDPWPDGVPGSERMIAYFRPECTGGVADWLAQD
ncbi:hypothetical protein Q8W25_15145 [Shimia thalassica]|uniref:hypothetical protein n=1 Tax=Shimia thalassica TaxID=1715693 RepID=UPI0027350A2D|nr:hypothetical protein [Shimia thalassica]MDP2495364.1 hypothetical protein [Shimia thalassica]